MTEDDKADLPPSGLHIGRAACTHLLQQVLSGLAPAVSGAPAGPWATARQAWLIDTDFADWPLGDPALLAALAAWLRPGGRQLTLIGQDFVATARAHPRLARWRRDWGHHLQVWQPAEGTVPPLLWGLQVGPLWLQRQDAADWRLRCFTEPVHARAIQAQIADFLQRCEPSWPVTTLGL